MQSAILDAVKRQTKRQAQGSLRRTCRDCSSFRRSFAQPSILVPRTAWSSRQDRFFYHTTTKWRHRTSSVSAAPAAAQVPIFDPHDDDEETTTNPPNNHKNNSTQDARPNWEHLARRQMLSHMGMSLEQEKRNLSSLDLELGEGTVWDDEGIDEMDYSGDEEEDEYQFDNLDRVPQFTTEDDSSPKTVQEMLRNFDPDNPPSSNDLKELQIWIECHAHQEGLLKYQKILDDARNRKDYAALSSFQKQVLRWFPPLKDAIARLQSEYVLKKGDTTQTSLKRYGPYLCTLPAEKLAVITAHEALLHTLLHPGEAGNPGTPLIKIAHRLGSAVEQEVLVHRMLHKRAMEQQKRNKERAQTKPESQEDAEEGDMTDSANELDDKVEGLMSDESTEQWSLEGSDDEVMVDGAPVNWTYASSHLNSFLEQLSRDDLSMKKKRIIRYAIRRAKQTFEKDEWTVHDRIGLGALLLKCLIDNAHISVDGRDVPAFAHETVWMKGGNKQKQKGVVVLNETLFDRIVVDKVPGLSEMTTRYKPMILPPQPWKNPDEGGYLWLKSELMRFHGSHMQKDALSIADMSTLYRGLNVLGQVPWKINKQILDVAWQCWEENIPLGEIPSRVDFTLPDEPIPPPPLPYHLGRDTPAFKEAEEQKKSYIDAMHKFKRIRQRNMDLRSLRCSAMLKLDQAEKFKDFEEIFFPYNIDFRGRAYPIPPHLSNVGSDLCRGMLKFSKAKPLGERGFFWLKVHLANFAGMDKMTFEDRAAFVDTNMDKVRQSAEDPFAGDRWWMGFDDPFQGLATCMEIVRAIDSGNPETYMCSLPVHMDGSCNGLQHYAALGRDRIGGRAVNLCADKEPQDVYIGVMHEVIRRVNEEVERVLDFDDSDMRVLSEEKRKELRNHRGAQLVHGLIDRGVVKRTVMTSVYGVTFIGARNQIEEKIRSKLEGKGYDVDEMEQEIFGACSYLATITMQAVGDLFVGAKQTMDWLTTCARMITSHGYPVAWISPIGVPAIQPYRQKKSSTIVTLMQVVTLMDDQDDLPLHKSRQVSAFPPNYVHSLDSSHMLLTALEMDKRGLAFSAVHDSFWTHACDIDEMNSALRDVFVDLYSKPLLEELKASWEMRYPDLEFPPVPEHGQLKLEEVKDAPYFFQ